MKNQFLNEATKLERICTCQKKAQASDKLLKCHNELCSSGKFFHLSCMSYKRYPNNAKTSWVCNNCKITTHKGVPPTPTTMEPQTSGNTDFQAASTRCDPSVLFVGETVNTNVNKTGSLGCLTDQEFALIKDAYGWLDCTIIHQAQICLKQLNPNIEGLQRPTLGPIRNFDVVGGEFIQILHSGGNHWVCVSSIGCSKGYVNLYDSLFHDVVCNDIEDQVRSLLGDEFRKLTVVPVQQQLNGSDCGVFAIAYATSLAFMHDPKTIQYDIPKMRPHLLNCVKSSKMEQFPTVDPL